MGSTVAQFLEGDTDQSGTIDFGEFLTMADRARKGGEVMSLRLEDPNTLPMELVHLEYLGMEDVLGGRHWNEKMFEWYASASATSSGDLVIDGKVVDTSSVLHTARARRPKAIDFAYPKEDCLKCVEAFENDRQQGLLKLDGFSDEYPWNEFYWHTNDEGFRKYSTEEKEEYKNELVDFYKDQGLEPRGAPPKERPRKLQRHRDALVKILSRLKRSDPSQDLRQYLNNPSDWVPTWEQEWKALEALKAGPFLKATRKQIQKSGLSEKAKDMRNEAGNGSARLSRFTEPTSMCQIWIPNEFKPPLLGKKVRPHSYTGIAGIGGSPDSGSGLPLGTSLDGKSPSI